MYLRAWTLLASLSLGAIAAAAGCEFIASADRDLIPPEDAGSEASEGTGGAGADTSSTHGPSTGPGPDVGGQGACAASGDCPGEDTPCAKKTCLEGQCNLEYEPSGTPLSEGDQIPNDCKTIVCDGGGGTQTQENTADVPLDVAACTFPVCNGDMPGLENELEGTFCSRAGGSVCDGDGNCVECTPLAGGCPLGEACVNETCVPPTCSDLVQNGQETDIDCGGGSCPDCADDQGCVVDSDCASAICDAGQCGLNGCTLATAVDITGAPTVAFGGAAGDSYAPACFLVGAGTMVTFEGDFTMHPLVGGKVVAGLEVPEGASSPFFPTTSSGASKSFTLAAGRYGFYCDNHGAAGMRGAAFVTP